MSLKSLRAASGFTQRELGERSGVNPIQIANFERGARNIENMPLKNAVALCDALGVKDLRRLLD